MSSCLLLESLVANSVIFHIIPYQCARDKWEWQTTSRNSPSNICIENYRLSYIQNHLFFLALLCRLVFSCRDINWTKGLWVNGLVGLKVYPRLFIESAYLQHAALWPSSCKMLPCCHFICVCYRRKRLNWEFTLFCLVVFCVHWIQSSVSVTLRQWPLLACGRKEKNQLIEKRH